MTTEEQAYYKKQGALLKALREMAGKSRYDAAEYFDISYNYVSRIERGEKPLSSYSLSEWGIFLGVMFIFEDGKLTGYKKAGV